MNVIRAGLRKVGMGNVHTTKDFAEFLGFGMWLSDTKRIIAQMVANREVDSAFQNGEYHLTILWCFPEGKYRIPDYCEVREWVYTLDADAKFSSADIPADVDKEYWVSRLQKMVQYGELKRDGKVFNAETRRNVTSYRIVELMSQPAKRGKAVIKDEQVVVEPTINEPKKIVWEPWPVVRK